MTFKRCGFLRGLDNEYRAKVKIQYPKTLEEAITDAQIYDDTLDLKHMHGVGDLHLIFLPLRMVSVNLIIPQRRIVIRKNMARSPRAHEDHSLATSLQERDMRSCVSRV